MQKLIRILLLTLLLSSLFVFNCAFAATITLPRTGQTTCYDAAGAVIACTGTGQDGDKLKGAVWSAATRFTDNNNGTITDTLTGLIWLKNANCFNTQTWIAALAYANTLASGACGLSDGSTAGQWRMPNITELESLVDAEGSNLTLPTGHPFTVLLSSSLHWSGSTYANNTANAWGVAFSSGSVNHYIKNIGNYVWPVRDGQ